MAPQNKNPRNQNTTLFKKLTRLFSGPLTLRKRETYKKLRRSHLNIYGNEFTSVSGQSFRKSSYNPFENLQAQRIQNQNRGERYREFDQMEYSPDIASALDIYADEITYSTDLNPVVNIECTNEEIKMILHSFLYDVLGVEYNLFGWVRQFVKYGDYILYADIDANDGVTSVIALPSQEVERLEGEDETNPNYVQYQWNSAGITFENWQIVHFRNLANDKYAPYGVSILDAARRAWRQLTLIEDSMMSYRIVRSPERRVFYIDVGGISPENVENYVEKVVTNMKRHQIIDEDTGRVDLRYNPLSVDEDYYIPVRGNSNTRIESLPGGNYTGDIDDVKYLRDKLFSALKVPQSYLSRDENATEDKTTLSQKDIMFAKTVQRLQKPVISELEKLCIVHLLVLGYPEEDAVSFSLTLNNPSKIAELQELEALRTKFEIASQANEEFFSLRWIGENILGLSKQEIVRIQREKVYDAKYQAALNQIIEGGEMEAGMGGGLGGEMGDLEGGEMGDIDADEELAGMTGGAEGEIGGDEAPDPEEGDLLAAPGKRDEYTTPGAKGKKYKKVATDKRNMGARKRAMKGAYNDERRGRARRSVVPGLEAMSSLASGVMQEGKQPDKYDSLLNEIEDFYASYDKDMYTYSSMNKGQVIESLQESLSNEEEKLQKLEEVRKKVSKSNLLKEARNNNEEF